MTVTLKELHLNRFAFIKGLKEQNIRKAKS